MKTAPKLVAVLMAVIITMPAFGDVRLDLLSSCGDIAAAQLTLYSAWSGCRSPTSEEDRRLALFLAKIPGSRSCFLATNPSERFDGFSCLLSAPYATQVELTCIRSISKLDLDDYEMNYKAKYSEKASNYLRSAATCPAGNGDASPAVESLMPIIVSVLAQFRFGFTLPVSGSSRAIGVIASSVMIHGFGDEDPSIVGGTGAIEFFHTWRSAR